MKKKSTIKFYFMQLCGLVCLLSVLLPWMSYGVGSKTGIDIGRITLYTILISGLLYLLFSYIYYKTKKIERSILILTFLASIVMFVTFLFELLRITYQTTIAKNLPVEMFGVASMAAAKIHIGYGLWLGVVFSFLPMVINFIVIKRK